jgi:hypothetical protein
MVCWNASLFGLLIGLLLGVSFGGRYLLTDHLFGAEPPGTALSFCATSTLYTQDGSTGAWSVSANRYASSFRCCAKIVSNLPPSLSPPPTRRYDACCTFEDACTDPVWDKHYKFTCGTPQNEWGGRNGKLAAAVRSTHPPTHPPTHNSSL